MVPAALFSRKRLAGDLQVGTANGFQNEHSKYINGTHFLNVR